MNENQNTEMENTMKIVVLGDGETFDLLDNCKIVDIPDDIASSTEAIEEFLRTLK